MQEGSWFQKALTDFTREAAVGGAIRHLTDLGYTVEEIGEEIAFPISRDSLQRAVWQRLLNTGMILCEEPWVRRTVQPAEFVREYDKYGRPSFRCVTKTASEEGGNGQEAEWRELKLSAEKGLDLLLHEKTAENGVENSYISCEFGGIATEEPGRFREMLQALDERQREYVEGLPWDRGRVYHRLTSYMTDLILRLYHKGMYCGKGYFLRTREWVEVSVANREGYC